MEADSKAETFSEALFTYLWFTENLISGHTAAETVGDLSEFISEVAKAVVVLSALTVPSFNESMEEYFKRHDMSRRSVFTFLTRYCFDNHAENEDIFAVVLNTCTFVYRLVIFCQHRGHVEYIEFASMCWSEIFEMDLKEDFYSKGGWEEFRRYVSENRYVPKDKDTDHKAFINFLEEINYLFPKLNISEPDEYTNFISTAAGQLEASNSSEEIGILSPELLATHFCQCNNPNIFETSDESGDENVLDNGIPKDADREEEMNRNQTSDEASEPDYSSDDSDEELFQELVRESLSSIGKINATPPSEDCVVCKNETELRTASHNDSVCPKHNPDSFYYLVTNSEVEELYDED